MCGIVGAFNIPDEVIGIRSQVLQMVSKVRHRGPDWSGIYENGQVVLAHERLAIVDVASGKQPLYNYEGDLVLIANGEIYNYAALKAQLSEYDFQTKSDCEVIMALYQKYGANFLEHLNGTFAFALYDERQNTYLIARDHLGIIPLYMGWDASGIFYVASEMKALQNACVRMEEFPPGHFIYSPEGGQLQTWYQRDWSSFDAVSTNTSDANRLRQTLSQSVQRQLMSDVPCGLLLSGGLDSSINTALAKIHSAASVGDATELHSFAVGLNNSPDLAAARKVAEFIGTVHHEVLYTLQEGIDALRDVIYHLETYDVTTVRAATPMYLLARVINSMGIKVVLSGEGADELFGGYLYFHKAPDARAFHEETVRKLRKLHLYDCLRANKALAAWGVEGRVPFLDKEFIDVAMSLNPGDKMASGNKIEKWILRDAFRGLLPDEILWRQKEQFSDGVGYGWIDALKSLAEEIISDSELEQAATRFRVNPPMNKEAYYYRSIFSELFPSDSAAA
jgi:asparagine synthase (glutamine-hydrolysing)